MSTYRLNENILPWLTPGTPSSRCNREKHQQRAYVSLRPSSAASDRGDVCNCADSPLSSSQVVSASRVRSAPALPQRGQLADAKFCTASPALRGPSKSPSSLRKPSQSSLPESSGNVSSSPAALECVPNRMNSATRRSAPGFVPPEAATTSTDKLETHIPRESTTGLLDSMSLTTVRSSLRRERPVRGSSKNLHVAFSVDSIGAGASDDSLGSLLDYDISGDSSSSISLSSSHAVRPQSAPRASTRPARVNVDEVPTHKSYSSTHRPARTARPASALDKQRDAWPQRGIMSSQRRPHSASASAPLHHSYGDSAMSIQGFAPPLAADPSRKQTLLRIERGPVKPPKAPQIAWMGLARRAQLHERPTSSKAKRPSSAQGKRRRISSAPPRMRTAPIGDLELAEPPETESAPPSSPVSSMTDVLDSLAIDTGGSTLSVSIIKIEEEPEPILEIPIEEELNIEEIEEELVDEGYADDADAGDAAETIENVVSPPPSPKLEPVQLETMKTKSLKKAKFGARKKQGLVDDTDLLNEYMRNRHRTKATQDGTEDMEDESRSQPEWMKAKVMPSLQSCRFELPVCMTMLDGMSPCEYLSNFCIILPRRQNWYNKAFNTIDRLRQGQLSLKEVRRALTMIHMDALQPQDIDLVLDICELPEDTTVGRQLFHGVAALSERILAARLRDRGFAILPRQLIEKADFSAVDFKLQGVKVTQRLRQLFTHIMVDS